MINADIRRYRKHRITALKLRVNNSSVIIDTKTLLSRLVTNYLGIAVMSEVVKYCKDLQTACENIDSTDDRNRSTEKYCQCQMTVVEV